MRFCLACFPFFFIAVKDLTAIPSSFSNQEHPGHSERLAVLFVLSCSWEERRPLAGGIGCFGDTTIPVLPTRRLALFPMLIVSQRISCQHHCHHPCLSQLRFFPTNNILNCIIDLSLVTSTRSSHYSHHFVFITRRNRTLLVSLRKSLTGTEFTFPVVRGDRVTDRVVQSKQPTNQRAFEMIFLFNDSLFDPLFLSHHCHDCQESIKNPSPKIYLLHQFMYLNCLQLCIIWVHYSLPRLYLWMFDTFASSHTLSWKC